MAEVRRDAARRTAQLRGSAPHAPPSAGLQACTDIAAANTASPAEYGIFTEAILDTSSDAEHGAARLRRHFHKTNDMNPDPQNQQTQPTTPRPISGKKYNKVWAA